MTPIKAGDEVRVFPVYADVNSPETGWVAYVSVTRPGEYDARPVAWGADRRAMLTFRTADNRSTDTGGQYLATTPEWADKRARMTAARAVLSANCIALEPGHCLSVEQIEALAEVAKTFTTPEAEG